MQIQVLSNNVRQDAKTTHTSTLRGAKRVKQDLILMIVMVRFGHRPVTRREETNIVNSEKWVY